MCTNEWPNDSERERKWGRNGESEKENNRNIDVIYVQIEGVHLIIDNVYAMLVKRFSYYVHDIVCNAKRKISARPLLHKKLVTHSMLAFLDGLHYDSLYDVRS